MTSDSRLIWLLLALSLIGGACSSSESSTSTSVVTSGTSSTTTTTASSVPESTDASTNDAVEQCRPTVVADDEPGQQTAVQIEVEAVGNTYPVRLYVPGQTSIATAEGRLPVVLNWHGLGSDGLQQALLTNYEAVAEAEGFIVAHPTGGGSAADGSNLQAGWELAQFDDPGRDDVALAETLIDRLVAEHCADPARVYSTGMSNGGFFTSRLVCELSDRIAAAVAVAGVTHPEGCSPDRAVPLMAFHGTADGIVPFDGGESQLAGAGAPPELVDFFDQVMPDELAEFAADYGCEPDPEVVEISNEVTAFDYQGCRNDVPVRFIEIDGGGHTWPGAFLGAFMTDALGPTTTDVSATADGWLFMSRFSLDR